MSNLSYCRMRNTYADLRDSEEYLHDTNLSEEENKARVNLINLCKDIAKVFDGDDIEGYFSDNKEDEDE